MHTSTAKESVPQKDMRIKRALEAKPNKISAATIGTITMMPKKRMPNLKKPHAGLL